MFVLYKETSLERKKKKKKKKKKKEKPWYHIPSYTYILFTISLKANTLSDILAVSGSSLKVFAPSCTLRIVTLDIVMHL